MDLPIFNGSDPDEWIRKAENYFSFYRLTEEEKIEVAVISFEGEAFMWYQYEEKRSPLTDCQETKALILKYFQPGEEGNMFEQWMVVAVQQKRSVAEYRKEFVTK